MKFIILVIFIHNVFSTHLQIQEILIKLSEKLIEFNQEEESDIFAQLDKKVSFDDINIKSKHQCFSDYNQLDIFLEINDPQLQFLSLIAGCIIDSSMIEIKSGFTQIPKINNIVFGAYINQSENDILLLVFRTFYHKSLLVHQCRLDGFSNQCIKGNNDHVQKLGSTCTAFYKDVFCNDETVQDTNELLWVFITEYKMFGLLLLSLFFNKINQLKQDSKIRISIIMFILLFILFSSWEFLAVIAMFIFFQQYTKKSKFHEAEQFIVFSTVFQIFLNNYIQLDSFYVEQQLAEVFISVYVLLFFLQLGMAIFSKRIQLFCILYLMSYYIEYIKALVKLNTLVQNKFKFGMVFLNIIIGNIQQLNAINLVKLKNSILHVLLGEELPFFIFIYSFTLVFILLQKGHYQLQLKQPETKKNIHYPIKCLAEIQLSFLFLPLTVLKAIFHKTEEIDFQSGTVFNFYLFWIYFFYFPSDFPFIALGVGFIQLFFNENNMFYKIYQEIKQTVGELKVDNIKMATIVNDFKLLIKI